MGLGRKRINHSLPETRLIHLIALCLLAFLTFYSPLLAEEPFAPWAKMTPGGEATSQQKTPTQSEIGIPAYPNAYIISIVSIEDKKSGKTIHVVHLVSADTPEAIKAFYQKKLPEMKGWKFDEVFEAFYTGEDYTTAMAQLQPYMEIMEVSLNADDLKPVDPSLKQTLKARIQIAYNPK
ncbi:MAG: hypothetical protein PVH61_10445 [Candidatus Aminicenantes bacterium]|jgi:hypothetical protein